MHHCSTRDCSVTQCEWSVSLAPRKIAASAVAAGVPGGGGDSRGAKTTEGGRKQRRDLRRISQRRLERWNAVWRSWSLRRGGDRIAVNEGHFITRGDLKMVRRLSIWHELRKCCSILTIWTDVIVFWNVTYIFDIFLCGHHAIFSK